MNKKSEDLSISCMRVIVNEMINKANSGHPGIALGIAPILYTLFTKHINLNPRLEKWQNRDRFILSAGHGSAILYVILHLCGYEISLSELKNFRQVNSITPGHPESFLTPGVEAITGPLGQGIGIGVGCALAETIQAAKYNKIENKIVDHYTYLITSDGDLQEGASYEAMSLAGHWKLNKLIVFFDSNDIQLDGKVSISQSENMKKRFESFNWNYILVRDGNNVSEIDKAIIEAKKNKDKPTIIEVKTIIGYGATYAGTSQVHGAPLGKDIENLYQNLNWNEKPFTIPNHIYKDFRTNFQKRGNKKFNSWIKQLQEYSKQYPNEHKEFLNIIENKVEFNYKELFKFVPKGNQATRVSSGTIINTLANIYPNLIGGSADLASSTKIIGANGTYQWNNRNGRNISYGVREFAMTTINNGLAIHGGVIPFCGEFLVFSDYMKPGIRLASMMELQIIYALTHDSILIGEDGPTHQPIEQLAMFRAQPNLNVFRPADFKETLAGYILALKYSRKTPTILALSRQDLPQLDETNIEKSLKGAYIISEELGSKITIIATGSEVSLALEIKKELIKTGVKTNIVSMPCQELFDSQLEIYKNSIIPKNHLKISLEFGSTFGWSKYTGEYGLNIGINTFGVSGKAEDILEKFKLSKKFLTKKIIKYLNTIKK